MLTHVFFVFTKKLSQYDLAESVEMIIVAPLLRFAGNTTICATTDSQQVH